MIRKHTIYFHYILILLGSLLFTEVVKYIAATTLGNSYSHFSFGMLHYGNPQIDHKRELDIMNFDSLQDNQTTRRNSSRLYFAWQIRTQGITEFFSKIAVVCISLSGFIILFIRRRKKTYQFELIDWIAIYLACFIMKQVCTSLFFILHGATFCDYGMFAEYFNLPFWGVEWLMVILGISLTGYVVFNLAPPQKRKNFVTIGTLGTITGFVFWVIIGNLLFS